MMIITKIHKTHIACPATWDAEDEAGNEIQFYYRQGELRAKVRCKLVFRVEHGHEGWGSLSFDELKTLTKDHFTFNCEES